MVVLALEEIHEGPDSTIPGPRMAWPADPIIFSDPPPVNIDSILRGDAGGSADSEAANPEDDDEDNVGKIVEKLNRRFLWKKEGKDGEKAAKGKNKRKKEKARNRGNMSYKRPSFPGHGAYRGIEEFFSYLNASNVAANIYKDHLPEYTEKKREESVPQHAKTQDITYGEIEAIMRAKKMSDMACGGVSIKNLAADMAITESNGATLHEKWKNLKMMTYYFVLSVLGYQQSLT